MAANHPIVPGVEFKDIEGYPGYCVGDDGTAWSILKSGHGKRIVPWHQLRASKASNGYPRVTLCNNGKRTDFHIHTIVLEAFVGNCPEGMECLHDDGNPGNNRLKNLSWGTRQQNCLDKDRHGTLSRGSKNGMAKLTEDQIEDMRQLYSYGRTTYRELASQFFIDFGTVGKIIRGETWEHVS